MKKNIKLLSALLIGGTFFLSACSKDDTPAATTYYQQADQFGRPAINTVFVASTDKDAFNVTTPSAMGAAFQSKFQAKLLGLNAPPLAPYTTNLLGLNAADFTGVLATDVLTASTTGVTTFYDGTNVLTGRTLSDDVINVELILIFGGNTGGSNPGLTNDNISANDKPFLAAFPYEAAPW